MVFLIIGEVNVFLTCAILGKSTIAIAHQTILIKYFYSLVVVFCCIKSIIFRQKVFTLLFCLITLSMQCVYRAEIKRKPVTKGN